MAAQRRWLAYHHALSNLSCSTEDVISLTGVQFDECVPALSVKHSPIDPHRFAVVNEDGFLLVISSYPGRIADHFIYPLGLAVVTIHRNRCKSNVEWGIRAHDNIAFDVEWRCDGKALFTASGDRKTALWDLASRQRVFQCDGHVSSVKTVVAHKMHPEMFATGGRDACICLFDTRYNKRRGGSLVPVMRISCSQLNASKPIAKSGRVESAQSVTSLLYLDNDRILSSSACYPTLSLWDPRFSSKPCSEWPYQGQANRVVGFSDLQLDLWSSKFYAACTDGSVYGYSLLHTNMDCNKNTTQQYKAGVAATYYTKIALSPRSDLLLCGSSVDPIIFDTKRPTKPLLYLKGHSNAVSSVSWSRRDVSSLVTCADNGKLYIWRPTANTNSLQEARSEIAESEFTLHGNSIAFKSFIFRDINYSSLSSTTTKSQDSNRLRILSDCSNSSIRSVSSSLRNLPDFVRTRYLLKDFKVKRRSPLKPSISSPRKRFLSLFSPGNSIPKRSRKRHLPSDSSAVSTKPRSLKSFFK